MIGPYRRRSCTPCWRRLAAPDDSLEVKSPTCQRVSPELSEAPGPGDEQQTGGHPPTGTCPVTEVNFVSRNRLVTCLLLAVPEGIDYWEASDIRYRRYKVQFRFWLITSLIVAFVAYSGVFGIQLLPAADVHPVFADRDLGVALMDEDAGRGR